MPLGHLSNDTTVPIDVIVDGGNEGWSMLLRQNNTFIGSISRKYSLQNISAYSSQIKEAYALKEGLKHFRDKLFNRPINIIHDHQKLENLFQQASGPNDFVTRIIFDTSPLLTNATFCWKPRTHPDIQLCDALGRFT